MYGCDQPMSGNYCGGIVVYVNTNILRQKKSEYECENYDIIALDLYIAKQKWIYLPFNNILNGRFST